MFDTIERILQFQENVADHVLQILQESKMFYEKSVLSSKPVKSKTTDFYTI